MIDRDVVMDCAQRAGFGGVSRNQLYTRLSAFAHHLADHIIARNAMMCNEIGDHFRGREEEFSDGQMDGAYQCAELLTKSRLTR